MSVIVDDPRVRRQGDAFSASGWDVVAIGLGGGMSEAPNWPIRDFSERRPPDRFLEHSPFARRAALLAGSLSGRVVPSILRTLNWHLDWRLTAMLAAARCERVDVWLANDWPTLPAALALRETAGTPFGFDTHEFSTEEYASDWRWRLVRRPLAMAVERQGIARAQVVSCVSPGISAALAKLYGLVEAPVVILNAPQLEEIDPPIMTAGARIEVLYHGILAPGRGLEASIESVAGWRPEFSLTIRGPADKQYLVELAGLAKRLGVADRIHISPPVAMTSLVREASKADIGLFALPGHSEQNRLALPNKLFEYAMAGLAVCVSDLPDMSALVRQHDLGVIMADTTPHAIAAAINSFNSTALARHKAAARRARHVLNWQRESEKLVSIYDGILSGAAGCT